MNPHRHRWGGPWRDLKVDAAVKPALGLAFAPRGQVQLAEAVTRDVPEIDLKAKQSGCGCRSTDGSGAGVLAFVVILVLRRRK